MKKVLKNKKAFTLTEMIVVIAIIGILAGVLIPSVVSYIKKAQQNAAYQQAVAAYDVYDAYQTELEAGLISEYGKICYVDNQSGLEYKHNYDNNGICSNENCDQTNSNSDNAYEDFADYYNEITNELLAEDDGYNDADTYEDKTDDTFIFTADNGIIVTININDMSADYSK